MVEPPPLGPFSLPAEDGPLAQKSASPAAPSSSGKDSSLNLLQDRPLLVQGHKKKMGDTRRYSCCGSRRNRGLNFTPFGTTFFLLRPLLMLTLTRTLRGFKIPHVFPESLTGYPPHSPPPPPPPRQQHFLLLQTVAWALFACPGTGTKFLELKTSRAWFPISRDSFQGLTAQNWPSLTPTLSLRAIGQAEAGDTGKGSLYLCPCTKCGVWVKK